MVIRSTFTAKQCTLKANVDWSFIKWNHLIDQTRFEQLWKAVHAILKALVVAKGGVQVGEIG